MERNRLVQALDQLLEIDRFQDYAPNGLQVEGAQEVSSVVTAVTASLKVVEAAVERGADLLLVHHGYFWKGEDPRVIGPKQRRLRQLLKHEINLLAYHLPLDAHPELGNNALWGAAIGGSFEATLPSADLVSTGRVETPVTAAELSQQIAAGLGGRTPLLIEGHQRPIQRIGWCSGGAQDYIVQAAEAGMDAYLTGELSERSYHEAMEREICLFGCGHHATERFGVQALGGWITQQFGISCHFVDEDNPI
ncbi:MAG: Nif3-like dinuclear metal center hexameric protein [Gammaproteobacteria bacterium]|jgi:dinuclear metal center YbgI/SA1388 family protein|nr:Nif3-like dinuclear metal center hexameric protein [Gammaproteobacteria bacterium]